MITVYFWKEDIAYSASHIYLAGALLWDVILAVCEEHQSVP